jgi:hypothetical protein
MEMFWALWWKGILVVLCMEVDGCTRRKRLLQTRPRRDLYSHQTTDRSQEITEASLPSQYYIPSPSRRDGKSGRSPHLPASFPLQGTSESPLHAAGRVRRLGSEEAPSRRAHRRLLGLLDLGGSFRSAHVARPRPCLARPGQSLVLGERAAGGCRAHHDALMPGLSAAREDGDGGRRVRGGRGATVVSWPCGLLWGADVCQAFGMQVITRPWRRTGEDRARGGCFAGEHGVEG